jgi:hypothetical protein
LGVDCVTWKPGMPCRCICRRRYQSSCIELRRHHRTCLACHCSSCRFAPCPRRMPRALKQLTSRLRIIPANIQANPNGPDVLRLERLLLTEAIPCSKVVWIGRQGVQAYGIPRHLALRVALLGASPYTDRSSLGRSRAIPTGRLGGEKQTLGRVPMWAKCQPRHSLGLALAD